MLEQGKRRALLLQAAMIVFSSRGYTAATVDAIASAAGMSKRTLYQIFPSKVVLFDALLEEQLYRIPLPRDLSGLEPSEELVQLLLFLAGYLLDPGKQALVRLIVTDSGSSPELMKAFERLEISRDLNHIEHWVERQRDAGYLKVTDVTATAKLLFGMTIAEPLLAALLRAPAALQMESLAQQIRLAVRVFLVGVGAVEFSRAIVVTTQ